MVFMFLFDKHKSYIQVFLTRTFVLFASVGYPLLAYSNTFVCAWRMKLPGRFMREGRKSSGFLEIDDIIDRLSDCMFGEMFLPRSYRVIPTLTHLLLSLMLGV